MAESKKIIEMKMVGDKPTFNSVVLEPEVMPGVDAKGSDLTKSILNLLNANGNSEVNRLAFEESPYLNNNYAGIYKAKLRLLPNHVLKRLAVEDDLVAAIINARANMIGAFGRPQADRFTVGFSLKPHDGILDKLNEDEKNVLQEHISAARRKLMTCGSVEGVEVKDQLTLPQFFYLAAKNAVTFGKIAIENIFTQNLNEEGEKQFHSFRPMDAGTIYRAVPNSDGTAAVRKRAIRMLEKLNNERLRPERFSADDYAYVQVIDGHPVQAFTDEECIVHNFYPSTDVELRDSPVTPMDTVINAITTHINITNHNRMFFQTGRAAKGMLVFNSDDATPAVLAGFKQQFNAAINGATNSWRMPVMSLGKDDKLTWQSIDGSGRDMEFQYLSDMNCRTIMSAFQMSPEELPGMAHLSKGSNSQALSESNNEYLLIAHRDVGLRPLISQFEDVMNERIMPLVAPEICKYVRFKMDGLQAETAEKESIRLQQDMPIHMTFDEVLQKVEKKPIGKEFGGEFPLNQNWQTILDKYFYVGDIREHFFGIENASKDPEFQYVRDPFWFQWKSRNDMLLAGQTQDANGGTGGTIDGAGGATPGAWGGGASGQMDPQIKEQQEQMVDPNQQELGKSLDEALQSLSKSERQLAPGMRQLLAQQKATMAHVMQGYDDDARHAVSEVMKTIRPALPVIPKKKPK